MKQTREAIALHRKIVKMSSDEERAIEKEYHRIVPTFENTLGVAKDAHTDCMTKFEGEAFKVKFSHCAMCVHDFRNLIAIVLKHFKSKGYLNINWF